MQLSTPNRLILILLSSFILIGCVDTKPNSKSKSDPKAPIMAQKIKVDKSSPKNMYINSNNVHIYDLSENDINIGIISDTNSLEQFMIYDKVTAYETKEDWSYVEGQARDAKTGNIRPVGGWIDKDRIEEWKPEKFFTSKENVFRNIIKPIMLFDNGIEDRVIGQIEKGDSIRVLKGNGTRFYVITLEEKEGWINSDNLDISQLIPKGFGWKNTDYYNIPKSIKYIETNTIDKKYYPVRLGIKPEEMLTKDFFNSDYENVFKTGYQKLNTFPLSSDIVFSRASNEFLLRFNIRNKDNDFRRLNDFDKSKYDKKKTVHEDFFGMFTSITLYIPRKYNRSKIAVINGMYKEDFIREFKKWEKEDINEIVVFRFYTRDEKQTFIDQVTLHGRFAFWDSLGNDHHKGDVQKNVFIDGDRLVFELEIEQNGVQLDPSIPYRIDSESKWKEYQKSKYAFKPKTYRISIPISNIQNAGLNPEIIIQNWKNWKITRAQQSISQGDKYFNEHMYRQSSSTTEKFLHSFYIRNLDLVAVRYKKGQFQLLDKNSAPFYTSPELCRYLWDLNIFRNGLMVFNTDDNIMLVLKNAELDY